MHTIQSQMRTLHSLLETPTNMLKTERDAQNRRCQGRTVIHKNKSNDQFLNTTPNKEALIRLISD